MAHEIASVLIRKSLGALAERTRRCSRCHRVPLTGELIHELESHRVVCDLCLARLPESKRATVGSERVTLGERRLSVAPRAA